MLCEYEPRLTEQINSWRPLRLRNLCGQRADRQLGSVLAETNQKMFLLGLNTTYYCTLNKSTCYYFPLLQMLIALTTIWIHLCQNEFLKFLVNIRNLNTLHDKYCAKVATTKDPRPLPMTGTLVVDFLHLAELANTLSSSPGSFGHWSISTFCRSISIPLVPLEDKYIHVELRN